MSVHVEPTHSRPQHPTCPYCHAPLDASEPAWECPGCGTKHHTGCARENGRCTILGCERHFVEPTRRPVARSSSPDVSLGARLRKLGVYAGTLALLSAVMPVIYCIAAGIPRRPDDWIGLEIMAAIGVATAFVFGGMFLFGWIKQP